MAAETAALVGLASSTITFFDFSIRLCRVAREIRKACGELPPEIESCHRSIVSFERMLGRLQRISQLNPGCCGPQTELDSDLHDLVDECRKNGEELLALLEKMKPKIRSQRGSKAWMRDMQTALRVARKEGKLRRLEQDFRAFKNDMCLLLNERMLVAADATLQALERHQEGYLQALSKSSENERQVIASLTRYDDMLNALRREMMVSGDTSDRIAGLLETALEKGGKRELDPRFIYIAIPSVSLNLLPCWNQFAQKAARALRLPNTGHARGKIYKILQPTPSQIRWRLLESSDEIGQTNLQLTGTEAPRTILFSTPGRNNIGIIEASAEVIGSDEWEIWTAAYRQDVGWKYWVLWQTVQKVSPILYRKNLSSGYERYYRDTTLGRFPCTSRDCASLQLLFELNYTFPRRYALGSDIGRLTRFRCVTDFLFADEPSSPGLTSTEGKREFTWGVEIIGGFDRTPVRLFIGALFTAGTLFTALALAMETNLFLGPKPDQLQSQRKIGPFIQSTDINSRIHRRCNGNNLAALFLFVINSMCLWSVYRKIRSGPFLPRSLILRHLFALIIKYLPFAFRRLKFSLSIVFFLYCNATFAHFSIITGTIPKNWRRSNWAARRRLLFAIFLYIEAPWVTFAYFLSTHHKNTNGIGVRWSLEGKQFVFALLDFFAACFSGALLVATLRYDPRLY